MARKKKIGAPSRKMKEKSMSLRPQSLTRETLDIAVAATESPTTSQQRSTQSTKEDSAMNASPNKNCHPSNNITHAPPDSNSSSETMIERKFTLFPKLPAELRIHVYKLFPEREHVEINPFATLFSEHKISGRWAVHVAAPRATLLWVCQESRNEAKKNYIVLGSDPPRLYTYLEETVLVFRLSSFTWETNLGEWLDWYPPELAKNIKYVLWEQEQTEDQVFSYLCRRFPRNCVRRRDLRRLEGLESLNVAYLDASSDTVTGFEEECSANLLLRRRNERRRDRLVAALTDAKSPGWNPPPGIRMGRFIFGKAFDIVEIKGET